MVIKPFDRFPSIVFYVTVTNFVFDNIIIFAWTGEAFHNVISELKELPDVNISNLPLILKVQR